MSSRPRRALVEVVGAQGEVFGVEELEGLGFDVDDAVLVLEFAVDFEELAAGDEEAFAVVEVGVDDDVADAGFVFHGEEDEAEGGAGALPGDDGSGGGDEAAVGLLEELLGGEDVRGGGARRGGRPWGGGRW